MHHHGFLMDSRLDSALERLRFMPTDACCKASELLLGSDRSGSESGMARGRGGGGNCGTDGREAQEAVGRLGCGDGSVDGDSDGAGAAGDGA